MKEGFLQRTPKGRVATAKAYQYLGITPSSGETNLFNS
ncbi:MAG: hypothetical protein MI700_09790 [Balneolales bacterium]|nr:hypothetical protein [Balneolales bacterium]